MNNKHDSRNVLYLINHAGKAGTERYVYTLMSNARKYGYTPYFAYNERGLLLDQVEKLGIKRFQIEMRSPYDIKAIRSLRDVCVENSIDVIHTNYLRENYIALLTKKLFVKNVKVIYTNHFVIANKAFVKVANRFLTRDNHKIISVCRIGAKKLIENGNAKDRIIVIHNAVDLSAWDPAVTDNNYKAVRKKARESFNLSDDDVMFLCASRFAHDKGHRFYLNGISRFFEHGHGKRDCRFVLAGDGPLLGDIKQLASEYKLEDNITFAGFVQDLKPLFYAADVYVNPSEHEALSFLILEALAAGLPVIATDMGGNSDIVNAESGCGILIDYNDVEMLSSALLRLFDDADLRAELKVKTATTVKDKFSIEQMLESTFNAYE